MFSSEFCAIDEEFGANAVISEFHSILTRSTDIAVAVAAVKVLTGLIERSSSTTIMELHEELSEAATSLQRGKPSDISLKTACDLFLHFVGRARNVPDFEQLKKTFIEVRITLYFFIRCVFMYLRNVFILSCVFSVGIYLRRRQLMQGMQLRNMVRVSLVVE